MSRFIECNAGWVNLDHVATIHRRADKQNERWMETFTFSGEDGRTIDTITQHSGDSLGFNPEHLADIIVPATQGQSAIYFWCAPENDDIEPTLDDIQQEEVAIVAWRIEGTVALPIYATDYDTQDSGSTLGFFIRQPDGTLWMPDGMTANTPEDARRSRLAAAQSRWHTRHPPTGKDAADTPPVTTLS